MADFPTFEQLKEQATDIEKSTSRTSSLYRRVPADVARVLHNLGARIEALTKKKES